MTTAVEPGTFPPQDVTPMVVESEKVAPPAEAVPILVPETTPVSAPEPAPSAAPAPAPDTAPEPVEHVATITHAVKPDAELAAEEAQAGKRYTPFIESRPECKPEMAPPLADDQEAKYAELLQFAESIETVPVSTEKGAESRPLNDEEKIWLTRECLLRYLRASKWGVAEAKKRLEGTLIWRREYGVYDHTVDYITPEMETGKMYTLGFDNIGRPCLYLNPARQNTERSPRQVHALVFMLERVIDMMGPAQETLALLIDFKSATNSTSPSVGQGRQVLSILQMHYPERLGRSLIINSESLPPRQYSGSFLIDVGLTWRNSPVVYRRFLQGHQPVH